MKQLYVTDIPAQQIPQLRYKISKDRAVMGSGQPIMLTTAGGLGDQVCAEPTLRYAFKLFEGADISLFTDFPDLFTHLPFKKVYRKAENPNLNDDDWLVLHTNPPENNLAREIIWHHFTQVVDFSSLCALQRQIPNPMDRQIFLPLEGDYDTKPSIIVHPGRHWVTKTFPEAWWNEVLLGLAREYGAKNIGVIGQDGPNGTGTVDVKVPNGAHDLRNKLSLTQLIDVLNDADTLITNDSAPLHIASAGGARIVYVASCKRASYITHWRNGKFGQGMLNLGNVGYFDSHSSPLDPGCNHIDQLPHGVSYQDFMKALLPPSMVVVGRCYG